MTISTKAFAYLVAAAALLSTSVAHAAGKVRIGFPVQIHTANMMLLQDYAKRDGVDLDVAVMRGYPSIQLALTTNELDIALLGFVNVGLMEEKGFRDQI